ncbi:MAG: DNA-processing protein DprA [Rhizobiaceae bacterium]
MSSAVPGTGIQRKRFKLSDQQRLAWLRLIRSENVGPATFRDLINHFGTASAALEAVPELARRGGIAARIRIASSEDGERELEAAARLGARLTGMGEPDYPPLLRSLDPPPPVLSMLGNSDAAQRPCLAMVGSRNASISGQKFASRLASELGQSGYSIVSGLARGIDSAAHRASLTTGTVAVFAGGLDHPFPEENVPLAREIIENDGLLVSEMPIGWKPRNIDFPRRNRIIAGLALGVVVIEAARRSGSLITARLANEIGRLVFAVPGSPLDPRSEGTNHLIRQGATLITCADDVRELVTPAHGEPQLPFLAGEPGGEAWENEMQGAPTIVEEADQTVRDAIISALGPTPAEVDDIIRFCDASAGQVQLVLLELDLAGRLERHAGNRVSLSA